MQRLKLCTYFFEDLARTNIRYCHWKSNCRLDKALEGKTDLDLLIHKDDKKKFEESILKFDFKQLISEMAVSDLKEAERDHLLGQEGYQTFNHFE